MDRVDPLRADDPEQIGSFKLLGRLGEGGMGRVYLGATPGGRRVAIKVVRPDYADDPEFRRRFAREVAAARAVGGLHTAAVVAADPDASRPWMASAYIAGPSLADAVAERGPLDEAGVRALAAALAEGLAAIHSLGLTHRDLKPSNVILADDGARIIDFGIARAAGGSALTAAGLVLTGVQGFMSPEQLSGGQVGPSSDMFSLGATLVYAATGQVPFGDGEPLSLMFRLVNEAPHLDRVPDDLRPIIERALAKNPAERPTARELLARLARSGLLPDRGLRAVSGQAGQEDPAVSPEAGALPPSVPEEAATSPEGPKKSTIRRMRARVESRVARSQPHGGTAAAGFGGRRLSRRGRVAPGTGPQTAFQDRPQDTPRSAPLARRLASRVLSWVMPPAVLAVLQSDRQALEDDAMRLIEDEIDSAYSALGLPPGLDGSVLEGRFDGERH